MNKVMIESVVFVDEILEPGTLNQIIGVLKLGMLVC